MVTQQQVSVDEAMTALFSDRRRAMSTLLQIEDKNRQLVPFKLNPIQEDVIMNSSWRDIYVKPGQVGFTSVIVGDYFLDNITINGTVSVIISYDEFSAQRQVLKAKRYHQSLERVIPTIPKLDHKSSTELSWQNRDTNFYSTMYIFSARSYVVGRGEAIHNLLLDEYAFWPIGTHEQIFASAVQRVPLKPGMKIRVGSTANGEDNPFHEMYMAAKEGTTVGRSVYRPHFYSWIIHPEYVMYADDPFCMPGDDVEPLKKLTSDEVRLISVMKTAYRLDEYTAMAKIRWRRYKKAESASLHRSGETVLIFEQEYPEDDESCFVTAGDQAYNPDILTDKLRQCIPAQKIENIVDVRTGLSASLEIWHDKQEGLGYVVGIDPGKGKQSESVAAVWTFIEGFRDKEGKEHSPVFQHCATLVGFYDEAEMGEYCKLVGHYYNDGVLAPEDNLDLVSHIKDYPDLYWREDVRTGKLIRAIGWQTNVSTKPYMITEVSRNLDYIDCQDSRFWSQCRNIRRNSSLKSGIIVVGADDHHDASAIAIVCRSAMPIHRGYAGSSGDAGGWNENWGK